MRQAHSVKVGPENNSDGWRIAAQARDAVEDIEEVFSNMQMMLTCIGIIIAVYVVAVVIGV